MAIVEQVNQAVSDYLANADHIDEPYEATVKFESAIRDIKKKIIRLINTGKNSNGKYMIRGTLTETHKAGIEEELISMFEEAQDWAIGVKRRLARKESRNFPMDRQADPAVELAERGGGLGFLGFQFALRGDITVIRKSRLLFKFYDAKFNLRVFVMAVEGEIEVNLRI